MTDDASPAPEPLKPFERMAQLHRYLNRRFVSFDVDTLLANFEPFHSGFSDADGTVPLRFPGYSDQYRIRLGADAVSRRVTQSLSIRLPVLAPGFWFCLHGLMRDDYILLIAPIAKTAFFANEATPEHVPDFLVDYTPSMTYVETARELVRTFAVPQDGG